MAADCASSVLGLVERLYEAAVKPEAWTRCLDDLRCAFGADVAAFVYRVRGPEGHVRVFSAGLDPSSELAYRERWFARDPWAPTAERFPAGVFGVGELILSERELRRTEFYQGFMRPLGLLRSLGAVLLREGCTFADLGVLRSGDRPEFREREFDLLRLLMPHLERAVHVFRHVVRVEAERDAMGEVLDRFPVGLLLLDERGRLLRANRRARQILAAKDGLSLDGEGIRGGTARETERLRAVILEAARAAAGLGGGAGGGLSVRRPSGRKPLSLLVAPLHRDAPDLGEPRAAAALIVSDPERPGGPPPAGLLERLYGLTHAEARLAQLILRGRVPKEAARELGIRWNTARNQLKRVFAKTGTGRQAQLVGLLATSLPAVGYDPAE